MEIHEYVRVLRRGWKLLLLSVVLAVSGAFAYTVLQPKLYTAKTLLIVTAPETVDSNGLSSAYTGGLLARQRVQSYTTIIPTTRVAELVVDDLGLKRSPASIAKNVRALSPRDTVLILVQVTDNDPQTAQAIADSIGRVFPELALQFEQAPTGLTAPVKVSVVQFASLPTSPTSPRPVLNLVVGLGLGVFLGVGLVALRNALNRSVNGPEEATQILRAPVLGMVPYDKRANTDRLVVVSTPRSARAEAFRQLRTNLQFADVDRQLRSVVVTSSVPGEGKTTTACNLAVASAQAGLRVVLVEGDLRRPRVGDYMGLDNAVGVTSVLLGRAGVDDALQPWGDQRLAVLTSGPLPPNPSELLGSAGMEALLEELEGLCDLVVVDAPPLLPVTDAALLGAQCSGTLLVIRSEETHRSEVQRASDTLEGVGADLLGAVLNMVPADGVKVYGYGYQDVYAASAGAGRTVLPQTTDRA